MRLTNENKLELLKIYQGLNSLKEEYLGDNVPLIAIPSRRALLKIRHGDELESYKIKLENLLLDTDVKEQAFKLSIFWTQIIV